MKTLSSSNGLGTVVYDATQYKITEFLEHPYQAANATTQSRNFVYDSYPGIRVGTNATWLNLVTPTVVEYVPATGVIHTQSTYQGVTIDEYVFQPMSLTANAAVMMVKVTNVSATAPIDLFSLFNYQVGTGSPAPGNDNETISYDATHDAFYESGPSGIAFAFTSIEASTHHGVTPDNPYASVNSAADLADNQSTGSPTSGAVSGFQTSLGTLNIGASGWAGWVSVLASDANGEAAVQGVRSWINGQTPAQILSAEESGWASWITPAPSGASTLQAALDAQSQVMLKMGQVTESGSANGQIMAAISPGEWNITWVRDMAYSVVALVRSHHYAEAKAAIAFQLGASAGQYQSYLPGGPGDAGVPYQISVCRYYGDGSEWSDSNDDGPNIEFDGFGLFLWSLDEYVKASGDTTSLSSWWPEIKSKVADVLVDLQEPTGLIAPDSSIWEVHWDGQQRHFAYTTASAANGLCAASRLATAASDSASSASYLTHGSLARDAIVTHLLAADGTIGQSIEALAAGSGWLDASPIEALNWGLVDPKLHVAQATMTSMVGGLVPPSGRGFMRDQSGAYYDSQEWVFIDLRSDVAFALGGNTTLSSSLFTWNVNQGADNFNELSELHDATTADYAGAAPMVGFGAGAYIIALSDLGKAVTPTCGSFAKEPDSAVDAGLEASVEAGADARIDAADAAPTHDSGVAPGKDAGTIDAGHEAGSENFGDAGHSQAASSTSSGCSMGAAPPRAWLSWAVPLLAVGLRLRRRRR